LDKKTKKVQKPKRQPKGNTRSGYQTSYSQFTSVHIGGGGSVSMNLSKHGKKDVSCKTAASKVQTRSGNGGGAGGAAAMMLMVQ